MKFLELINKNEWIEILKILHSYYKFYSIDEIEFKKNNIYFRVVCSHKTNPYVIEKRTIFIQIDDLDKKWIRRKKLKYILDNDFKGQNR